MYVEVETRHQKTYMPYQDLELLVCLIASKIIPHLRP